MSNVDYLGARGANAGDYFHELVRLDMRFRCLTTIPSLPSRGFGQRTKRVSPNGTGTEWTAGSTTESRQSRIRCVSKRTPPFLQGRRRSPPMDRPRMTLTALALDITRRLITKDWKQVASYEVTVVKLGLGWLHSSGLSKGFTSTSLDPSFVP